jgi:hypothetical protein
VRRFRIVAYVVVVSVFLGILASAAMADTVYCRPLLRDSRLIGFCFIVCNVPGPDENPCYVEGCIYDLHLKILTLDPDKPCYFEKIIRIPKWWTGVIKPNVPGPVFDAMTPPAGAGNPNPIKAGECKVFCLRITGRCLSPGACIRVRWVTTDEKGLPRARGVVKCCWPASTTT